VFEFGMSVGAAYRGVGVGSALLRAAIAWATAAGFAKIVLSVFPHNARAIAFYERHGFTLEGRRVRQFRRDGGYLDELLMGLPLTDGGGGRPGGADGPRADVRREGDVRPEVGAPPEGAQP
jgi:RimJ/RimL family protein N-acetyltransferase